MKHLHKAISLSLALALALAVGFSVPALAAETLAIQIEGPGIYTIELSGVVKQEQRTLLVASGADVYEKDETVYTVDPELFSYFGRFQFSPFDQFINSCFLYFQSVRYFLSGIQLIHLYRP